MTKKLWLAIPISVSLFFLISCQSPKGSHKTVKESKPVGKAKTNSDSMQIDTFSVNSDAGTEALFSPMPLRVGTTGSSFYHRPYSQRAQEALIQHGPSKRINYYSIQEIKASGRVPAPSTDPKNNAAEMFTPPLNPIEFAIKGDSVCTINRRAYQIPNLPADKIICGWNGYMMLCVPIGNCQPDQSNAATLRTIVDQPISMDILYFNAIPLGIGDANGDGDVTEADRPYLDACMANTHDSQNCRNCFDYDNDGDIDIDDSKTFITQIGTGNSFWIAANHSSAKKIRSRSIPLRVGMIGSNLYHHPDCPAVLRSRATHGHAKFLEFYSRAEVTATSRAPDNNATHGCVAVFQDWEY